MAGRATWTEKIVNGINGSGDPQGTPVGEQWFECDQGWGPLIAELEAKLRGLAPDFTIGQVKEKFGGLRFYANVGDVDEATSRQFYGLIRAAEARSFEICERCGLPGRLSRRGAYGWFKTLCSPSAATFGMEPVDGDDDEGVERTTT